MTWHAFAPLVQRGLLLPPFTMPQLLTDAAARAPDAPWIGGSQGCWSYAEGLASVRALAETLAEMGVRPKDRVALCLPNSPAAAIAIHAIWRAGAVPALLHPAYAIDIRRNQVALVSPRLFLGDDESSAALAREAGVAFLLLDEAPRCTPGPIGPMNAEGGVADLALLQFTGGTTGTPKAAMLTHQNLSAGLAQIALALPDLAADREKSIALAPFAHITGLNGVLGLITYLRGMLIVPPPAPADLADACADLGATYLAGPPTMLTALTQARELSGRRYQLGHVIAGGAPLPLLVKKRFEAATGAKVVDGYGLSETAPAVTLAGRPVAGTSVSIRCPESGELLPPGAVGEVCASGPQVMLGYWNDEQESAAVLTDGFLRTGDLGSVDPDGRLSIVDRLKDIIIASGYNIYPARIEDAICGHPAIAEVSVVGLPDAYRGETVAVAATLRPGHCLDLPGLTEYLSAHLSPMEMPRKLFIWDALPKSPAGKILRRSVRAGMTDAEREMTHSHGTDSQQ